MWLPWFPCLIFILFLKNGFLAVKHLILWMFCRKQMFLPCNRCWRASTCPPGLPLTLRHTHAHMCLMKGWAWLGLTGDSKAGVSTAMAPFRQEAREVTGLGLSLGGLPAWVPALQAPHSASCCGAVRLIWALQFILPPGWWGRFSHRADTILIEGTQSSLAKSPPQALGWPGSLIPPEIYSPSPLEFPLEQAEPALLPSQG